ncbi:AAA family ATPase [Actinospongicola halichondriae]|uniref:AAA family ATPase n=1 Tax=Actinospongicola halichondriae TaxID=3236844 RepID=UPI003D3C1D13
MTASTPTFTATALSNVTPMPVRWLIPRFVAIGKITLLVGGAGVGKGTFLASLTATVTTEDAWWTGDASGHPGRVLWISGEDDIEGTLRTRTEAAGADLDRVHTLVQHDLDHRLQFPEHADALRNIVRSTEATVVIIDPITEFLDRSTNLNHEPSVRRLMAALSRIAIDLDLVVIVVLHTPKTVANATYMASGSAALVNATRTELRIVPDPDDPDDRILTVAKSSHSEKPPSWRFHIDSASNDAALIAWDGQTSLTAYDLATRGTRGQTKTQRATDLLIELLAHGPRSQSEIRGAASVAGIGFRTIEKAKAALRIESRQRPERGLRGPGPSWWGLPNTEWSEIENVRAIRSDLIG